MGWHHPTVLGTPVGKGHPGGLVSPKGAGDTHEGWCYPGEVETPKGAGESWKELVSPMADDTSGVVPPRMPAAPRGLRVPIAGTWQSGCPCCVGVEVTCHLCVLPWDRHRRGPSRKQPDLREPQAVPRHSEAPNRPGLPALGAGHRPVGHRQPVGTWGHVWGHGWGHIYGDMGRWDLRTQRHMDMVTLPPKYTRASPPQPEILQCLVQGCAPHWPALCPPCVPPSRGATPF